MSFLRRSSTLFVTLLLSSLIVVQPTLAAMIDEDAPVATKIQVENPLEQPVIAPAPAPAPVEAVHSGKRTWYWWVLGALLIGGAAAAAGGGGGGGSSTPAPPDTTSVTATW